MARRYQLGWFSTGRGEGSRNLLRAVWDSIAKGEIKAEISFVFSNREYGQAEAATHLLIRSKATAYRSSAYRRKGSRIDMETSGGPNSRRQQ